MFSFRLRFFFWFQQCGMLFDCCTKCTFVDRSVQIWNDLFPTTNYFWWKWTCFFYTRTLMEVEGGSCHTTNFLASSHLLLEINLNYSSNQLSLWSGTPCMVQYAWYRTVKGLSWPRSTAVSCKWNKEKLNILIRTSMTQPMRWGVSIRPEGSFDPRSPYTTCILEYFFIFYFLFFFLFSFLFFLFFIFCLWFPFCPFFLASALY